VILQVVPAGRLLGPLGWQRCTLGRNGARSDKVEGDGATPIGRFPLRAAYYRPDRVGTPRTGLAVQALSPADGWCDDPANVGYNRFVTRPFPARHEQLWRSDGLYDLIVVIGYNDDPPVPGRGSAIFLHCATPDFQPTEGCVALAKDMLMAMMPFLDPTTQIEILSAR